MAIVRELVPIVKEAFQITGRLAKALCFVHVVWNYVGYPVYHPGPSMLPTIDNNTSFTERISARLGKVGSGDVVVIRSPEDPTKVTTKRIKAVEGDVVSYAPDPNTPDEKKTLVVPKGHVWVEGDNMHQSRDSRMYGAVPYALVDGRILLVFWPPKDIKFIRNKIL